MTHAELESAYDALCTKVERDAKKIFGLAGTGRSEAAAEAAAVLAEYAATCKAQKQMQQERTGAYDLAKLRVDATSASNSETGWERED